MHPSGYPKKDQFNPMQSLCHFLASEYMEEDNKGTQRCKVITCTFSGAGIGAQSNKDSNHKCCNRVWSYRYISNKDR